MYSAYNIREISYYHKGTTGSLYKQEKMTKYLYLFDFLCAFFDKVQSKDKNKGNDNEVLHWLFFVDNTIILSSIMKPYRHNRMEFTSGFVSSNSESEDQGFQEQKIKIKKQKPIEIQHFVFADEGNELLEEERPTDFKPRTLLSFDFKQHPSQLDTSNPTQLQQLTIPSIKQPPKLKKFRCLRDKYEGSANYKLVYSKLGSINKQDYLNSFLNLNQTVDYNPSHFRTLGVSTPPLVQQQLTFDSNFESGNLLYAYEATQAQNEYDLVLQNDFNTKGYNQWFYFQLKNANTKHVRLNIVNLVKKRSLFTEGVRPVCFSKSNQQWRSCGTSISYYKSMVYRDNGQHYYTLSFELEPLTLNDTIYIALNMPYTYSRMVRLVDSIAESPNLQLFHLYRSVEKSILCYSISNNAIPYLRIGKGEAKKQILVMARQHPGETVSSFVMESFLKILAHSNSKLLEEFEFIVVPMVNPDGVIYGNFRANLSGFDLNRQWLQPNRWLHPEIYFIKKLALSLTNLVFVLDLHGHSKKFNSFIYACKQEDPIMEKYYPFLMESCPVFNIRECTYGITMDKTTTARATIFAAGIKNVYTVETSFYGYANPSGTFRLSLKQFQSLAGALLTSLERFFLSKQSQIKQWQNEINLRMNEFQHWEQAHNNDSGSESNPSEDELSPDERQSKVMSDLLTNRKIVPRKKKKKKKAKRSESKIGATTGSKNKLSLTKEFYKSAFDVGENPKAAKLSLPVEAQTTLIQLGPKKKMIQDEVNSVSPPPIYQQNNRNKTGLFRQKDPKKTYFPSTQPRQPTKRKSLSNLLVERQSPEKVTISHQLDDREYAPPPFQQQSARETGNSFQNNPTNNRLLLQYNRKMKTRSKLESILNSNKLEDKINITIGKTVKREIDRTLEHARDEYSQNLIRSNRTKNNNGMPSIGIGNFSEQNHRKLRDFESRRFRSLKPVERASPSKKQHVYLSELMRPKGHEDSKIVCLKIQQDINKQMKVRSNSIKDRHIFVDFRTR